MNDRLDLLLKDLIDLLEQSPRIGSKEDIPEGTRYIQISDTLTNKFLKRLYNMKEFLYE